MPVETTIAALAAISSGRAHTVGRIALIVLAAGAALLAAFLIFAVVAIVLEKIVHFVADHKGFSWLLILVGGAIIVLGYVAVMPVAMIAGGVFTGAMLFFKFWATAV